MGAWTRQPGETTLYARIRRDAITPSRIDQLAAFASSELGRQVTTQNMVRWLRRYASFVETRNGTEFVLFEMPEGMVANLPDMFARQFAPLADLDRTPASEVAVDKLNQLLGTEEGEL